MATTARVSAAEPRKRRPVVPVLGRHRQAVETAVAQLATGPEHSALVEAVRALADHIDGCDEFDDKAWREYRLMLVKLMEATSSGGSDAFADELAELRAPLGDS